jgi:CubicO group peptidase (beta-lactamase class C family)
MRHRLLGSIVIVTLLGMTLAVSAAHAQTWDRARITQTVDSLARDALKDGRAAGLSVAVVRGRDTIVMKGYGFVDLEWDVPTNPRAIYEIGSVTKQFTAAAILQLQEQGKLSLDDELTKHLPKYPTQNHRITIRRLLDHTSGIKGYTELPEFQRFMVMKMPKDSLVALFSSKPFDFAPGEAQVYNNSAFFLLGLVIEKASGMSYAEYVQKNLFEKAGMPDSRYCSENALIKRRAHGYDAGPNGLARAAYLDHTWPYAAGSLCSTVGDLVAWNQALHRGKILTPASYRELISVGTLNDGSRLRYAKGIGVDSAFGRVVLAHGGGINGFLSDLRYFPADSLSVATLINTAGPVNPGNISNRILETIYGQRAAPRSVAFTGNAEEYAGEYRGVGRGRELAFRIAAASDGKGLTIQPIPGAQPAPLLYLGNDVFERGGTRYTFVRENGRITKIRMLGGAAASTLTRR